MNQEKNTFLLSCQDDEAGVPVLRGVQARGRLDGLLFELVLRQTYRNEGDRVLEVVYTFPLAPRAVLLGFAAELGGNRLEGAIVEKARAEAIYEKALTEGDAPVMLEHLGDGLHTANIGNLKPGEEIVLEVRQAQLLRFEQGQLRLAIPTTIAPRYGDAERAGLQPQQVPAVSLTAEVPLSLELLVVGDLAQGLVECPTHAFRRERTDEGLKLHLALGAWLDRDIVVTVTPREPQPSFVVVGRDERSSEAPVVLMAALQVPLATERERIALKLLVDCSGSMGGDSIASARQALHGVVDALCVGDRVSYSRFGSTVEHELPGSTFGPGSAPRLRALVDRTEADLGGTEMSKALRAVFDLRMERGDAPCDVLLVTDGEVWQSREAIDAARTSGHRVFVVAVGSAPAHGVTSGIAEATGGACEYATPGEALEQAAARMLQRIRQQAWREARIDWGVTPRWQLPLPSGLFGGDTVIALAGFDGAGPNVSPRLVAAAATGQAELAFSEARTTMPGDTLARMAAAERLRTADDSVGARQMALSYGLMSEHTNCVLVHRRADADKAAEQAEMHRVTSMLAAGWGATASIGQVPVLSRMMAAAPERSVAMDFQALEAPSLWRNARSKVDALGAGAMDEFETPAFLRRQADDRDEDRQASGPATLLQVADAVRDHVAAGEPMELLATHCERLDVHPAVATALRLLLQQGFDEPVCWLLLAWWVIHHRSGWNDTSAFAVLQPLVDAVSASRLGRAWQTFDAELGSFDIDRWPVSRLERLRKAMRRAAR